MPNDSRLLRGALLANACFSAAWALILLISPQALAPELGELNPMWLRVVGAQLAAFVPLLWWARRSVARPQPEAFPALIAVGLDALWILGTLALLPVAFGRFTPLGLALFVGVGVGVAVLAVAQWWGIDRCYAEFDGKLGTAHRVKVDVDVDVAEPEMWRVVSDLGGIHRHANLVSSTLDGEAGEGGARTCATASGARWSERVTSWAPGRGFTMRFVSEADDFPFPLDPMLGGWTLTGLSDHETRVTVWWSFTTRPRWLAPLMIPLMERKIRPDMEMTVASMAREARRSTASRRAST